MKLTRLFHLIALCGLLPILAPSTSSAQATAFTYQGRLSETGINATGSYDFQFALLNSRDAAVGNPQTNNAVVVTDGAFVVTLDFGLPAFDGNERKLQIGVRPAGSGADFTLLSPPQLITPAPYALSAQTLSGSVGLGQLPATVALLDAAPTFTSPVSFNPDNGGAPFFVGSSAQVTGLNVEFLNGLSAADFWKLGGNSGTTPGTQFLGTTDSQPLIFKVNNQRALRLEFTDVSYAPNLIAGYYLNSVSAGIQAATIGGGGGGIQPNSVTGDFGTVGGGRENRSTNYATVGGGQANGAFGSHATVPGGLGNQASGATSFAAGTRSRALGISSFAAGEYAVAQHDHSFVWADGWNATDFVSVSPREFAVRASGGVRMVTSADLDGNATSGVRVFAGGGSWSSLSDRNSKENFQPVDGRAVLERVAALPMTTWNYKSQAATTRHIGPMAQDFATAFDVGEDNRRISTVDADGVALAAIQGLHQVMKEKDAEIEKLKNQNTVITRELASLREAVAKILQHSGSHR